MTTAISPMTIPDLSATYPQDMPAATSPSKNPCMVRVNHAGGAASRYRNDPYNCPVLPKISHAPTAPFATHATNRLAPLPPALQLVSRHASRVKSEIARAALEYSAEDEEKEHQEFEPTLRRRLPIRERAPQGEPRWAYVKLKHEALIYNVVFPVSSGDYVVVEGDRGENIGCIKSLVHEAPRHSVTCGIIRYATDDDMAALQNQREREEGAKHFAQGVADALAMNIRIVDTEFQSDGNKLTVYFQSRRQIDFRRLQRQLFKQYRCRIWLVNWADVIHA